MKLNSRAFIKNIKIIGAVGVLSILNTVSFLNPKVVQASPWYQERDGVYGEIKYAEACNNSNAMRVRIIAEAGSRSRRVTRVDFKGKTRFTIGFNAYGQSIGLGSSYVWKPVRSIPNNDHVYPYNNVAQNDRRFYDTGSLTYPLATSSEFTPVKLSIHVKTQPAISFWWWSRKSERTVYDLGKIVDLGQIPIGRCSIYNDGTQYLQ